MHDCHQKGEAVDRKCKRPTGCVISIREVCLLVGRCDGHGRDVKSLREV